MFDPIEQHHQVGDKPSCSNKCIQAQSNPSNRFTRTTSLPLPWALGKTVLNGNFHLSMSFYWRTSTLRLLRYCHNALVFAPDKTVSTIFKGN